MRPTLARLARHLRTRGDAPPHPDRSGAASPRRSGQPDPAHADDPLLQALDELRAEQARGNEVVLRLLGELAAMRREQARLGEAVAAAIGEQLLPTRGELGWDDPRSPQSLLRALCLEAQRETMTILRQQMPRAICMLDHAAFLRDAAARAPAEGVLAEFGVFSGTTLRWMAEAFPARRFLGFDSFRGLPADWRGYKSFDFDRGGAPPEVPPNVELVIGPFEETVPRFAADPPPIALAHIDCDIYESARLVLSALAPHLVPGTILVFDEYFNYPGFREHEFRACAEFLAETGRGIEWLTYSGERAAGRLT